MSVKISSSLYRVW